MDTAVTSGHLHSVFRHGPRKKQSDVHDNSAADLDLSSGLERAPLYACGEFYR